MGPWAPCNHRAQKEEHCDGEEQMKLRFIYSGGFDFMVLFSKNSFFFKCFLKFFLKKYIVEMECGSISNV